MLSICKPCSNCWFSTIIFAGLDYLSAGNVTKLFDLPFRHFQPFLSEDWFFLALIEVKTGAFPVESLSSTFPFLSQFFPFPERYKGSIVQALFMAFEVSQKISIFLI